MWVSGFPGDASGKEPACQCRIHKRHGLDLWGRKIPWRKAWQPTPMTQMVKNLPAMQETWVQSPGGEDPLEKDMATHSSILAWRIPWTEEPDGLQSMGLQRVEDKSAINIHTHTQTHTHTHIPYGFAFNCLRCYFLQRRDWNGSSKVTGSQE